MVTTQRNLQNLAALAGRFRQAMRRLVSSLYFLGKRQWFPLIPCQGSRHGLTERGVESLVRRACLDRPFTGRYRGHAITPNREGVRTLGHGRGHHLETTCAVGVAGTPDPSRRRPGVARSSCPGSHASGRTLSHRATSCTGRRGGRRPGIPGGTLTFTPSPLRIRARRPSGPTRGKT